LKEPIRQPARIAAHFFSLFCLDVLTNSSDLSVKGRRGARR
jgi:hypothetical protein